MKNVLFEHLYHKPALDVDELFQQLMALREEIRPYVGDAVGFVHQALKEGKTILLEGQLGSMKDPDLGIFPMTTSSHTLAGFGCVGAAVPPHRRGGRDLRHQGLLLLRGLPHRALRQRAAGRGGATSCAAGAATRASSAPPPAVPAGWAGSTP